MLASQPVILPYAQQWLLPSPHHAEPYRIQALAVGEAPQGGYPVLYLLDGNTFFAPAAIMAQSLMVNPMSQSHAPMLLVGVGYEYADLLHLNHRAKDYTPPLREYASAEERERFGGAAQFAAFLDHVLQPMLTTQFAINFSQQAIFGHSFGGLFGAYSLLTQPNRFSHYLLSSPSIWWHEQRLYDFKQPYHWHNKYVRISVGGLEQQAGDSKRMQRAMVSNAQALAMFLSEQGAEVVFECYEHDNHGSAPFKALTDGFGFLQSYWQAESKCKIQAV